MKERGGGNQTDRPRWAGDGLLEIWGAPELLADLERVQLLGRRRSPPVQVRRRKSSRTAPHRTAPHPHSSCTCTFPTGKTGHFSVSDRRGASLPTLSLPSLPSCTGARRPRGGQQAGSGRESQRGFVETGFRSSLVKQPASQPACLPACFQVCLCLCLFRLSPASFSHVPPSPVLRAAAAHAWALTEVIPFSFHSQPHRPTARLLLGFTVLLCVLPQPATPTRIRTRKVDLLYVLLDPLPNSTQPAVEHLRIRASVPPVNSIACTDTYTLRTLHLRLRLHLPASCLR